VLPERIGSIGRARPWGMLPGRVGSIRRHGLTEGPKPASEAG